MATYYNYPASELPDILRGDISRDALVTVTVELYTGDVDGEADETPAT